MKNNGKNKNLIRIAAMTSMTIFSLMAVFTGTLAWFNANRIINNGSDNFNIQSISGRLSSVSFHQLASKTRDEKSGDATSFTFDSTASGTITYDWSSDNASFASTAEGKTSISLNMYEPLDKEQPLLLIFHLDNAYNPGDGSIYIKAETSADGFLGTKNTDATPKYALDNATIYKQVNTTKYYWLSSVVQFYNITFADDSIGYQYALTSKYATDNSLPLLQSSGSKFTTADNEADTCSFVKEATMYSSTSGSTVKNIGVVIDYYPDAIEYIYSTYLGNTILEDTYDGFLHFWCDWSMEVA